VAYECRRIVTDHTPEGKSTPGRHAWARAAHDTFADLQSQRLAAQPLARS